MTEEKVVGEVFWFGSCRSTTYPRTEEDGVNYKKLKKYDFHFRKTNEHLWLYEASANNLKKFNKLKKVIKQGRPPDGGRPEYRIVDSKTGTIIERG